MPNKFKNFTKKEITETSSSLFNQEFGYFINNDQDIVFPYIGQNYFYHLASTRNATDLHFFESFATNQEKYTAFLSEKIKRPFLDLYAAFQPFNEAQKSLYPFLKLAQKELTKGQPILNLWDRSGWTATLLLSLFPDHPIYTIWEGNKDVLGCQGFFHWFDTSKQHHVLYCGIDEPLPFDDDMFGLVVGLDALHRYNQDKLIIDLNRISSNDAAFIFPHVHLANADPVPFFERGCNQRHGRSYQASFKQWINDGSKKGFVISEPELFQFNLQNDIDQLQLKNQPDTTDYNALVAIIPSSWPDHIEPLSFDNIANNSPLNSLRILINPLYKIDFSTSIASVNSTNAEIKYLLDRHPINIQNIKGEILLTDLQCKLLYLSMDGPNLFEFSVELNISHGELLASCKQLEELGLIHVLPVTFKLFSLQTFLGHQKTPSKPISLGDFWNDKQQQFSDKTYLKTPDQSEFSYQEIDELVSMTILALQSDKNLVKASRIGIITEPNIESVLLFWAAMKLGLVLVPISSSYTQDKLNHILEQAEVQLLFVSEQNIELVSNHKKNSLIYFDSKEELEIKQNGYTKFSDWLSEHSESVLDKSPKINVKDLAVVLYTSGSTGTPKGVMLSHSNLIKSGQTMSAHFNWDASDRMLITGGLEYMSGLRHMTTAPVSVGSSVMIPSSSTTNNPSLVLAGAIDQLQPSLIAINPSLAQHFVHLANREYSFSSLRKVFCTGNYLPQQLKEDFRNNYQLDLVNYYGLTETSGICLAQNMLSASQSNDIGNPINCIAQIVDDSGKILSNGESGLLRLYSNNLSLGYIGQSVGVTSTSGGWFYTGDLGKIDDSGSFNLLGRQKEIIKTPAEKIIHTIEVETSLQAMPAIHQVAITTKLIESVERLIIFIVPAESINKNDIKTAIYEKIWCEIIKEKIPIDLRLVSELPYVNGKINKTKLIDELY